MRSVYALMAGVVLTALAAGPARAAPDMTFRVAPVGDPARCGTRCPKAIVAEGEIVESTPAAFVDFARRNARDPAVRSVIFIHSPGGKVIASMELGRAFRAIGAAAVVARVRSDGSLVAGTCFSACVYALMGAVKRVAPSGSRLGIHRMYTFENGPDPTGSGQQRRRFDDGGMRDMLAKYSAKMGVSSDLIHFAERTPSDSILMLSPRDIARWRLASPNF